VNTGPVESEDSSNRSRTASPRRWAAVAIMVLSGAAAVAGCSNSSTSSTTTSSSTTSTTTGGLSAAAVKSMQVALLAVGCYSGAVDGIAGPATTRAIRSFQSSGGLSVDGVYGANTKAKLLAAVAAGKKVCTTTTTTSTTVAASTTTAPSGTGVPAAATAAITAYETAHGPTAGTWAITSSALSSVNPNYVLFRIGPASNTDVDVQPGYGIVYSSGGTWTVIGFGSAEVGCPGTSQTPVVPAPVLSGFGLTCPTTS
jgi:peptidoglycan hydrolase-like protein with peptidoglycan-binding domain